MLFDLQSAFPQKYCNRFASQECSKEASFLQVIKTNTIHARPPHRVPKLQGILNEKPEFTVTNPTFFFFEVELPGRESILRCRDIPWLSPLSRQMLIEANTYRSK